MRIEAAPEAEVPAQYQLPWVSPLRFWRIWWLPPTRVVQEWVLSIARSHQGSRKQAGAGASRYSQIQRIRRCSAFSFRIDRSIVIKSPPEKIFP